MERVFQCPLCEECFESKICLENHLGDVHKRSNLAELIDATYAGESEPGSVITSQPVATNLQNCDSQIEISQKVTTENDQDDFDCCGCCFGDAEDCQSTGQQDGGGWLSSGEADGGGDDLGGSCD